MPNKLTPRLIRHRAQAFARQHGRCFYCQLPMWHGNAAEFAKRHQLTTAEARTLQCTAEHLVALQDGGTDAGHNVVAACRTCNALRHKRPQARDPDAHRRHVRHRVQLGRWHVPAIMAALA